MVQKGRGVFPSPSAFLEPHVLGEAPYRTVSTAEGAEIFIAVI
jgi:hypothetical protein